MKYDDLCSPVLVKEVRQALRGRTFATGFMGALAMAILLAGMSFLEGGGATGERVVMPIYFVLAAALVVFVPFHAHQAMRQEDAEGARDLLALSPLGPWRIVFGKLAAALVLGGLTLAAFLPFVIVIALQPGVDTAGVLTLLAHLSAVAVVVTALGVASGAMQANRFLKGGGVVILSFVALGTLAIEVKIAEGVFNGGDRAGTAWNILVGWVGCAAFAPLLLGVAASALARDDRDISRGLRIAWVAFAGVMALIVSVAMPLQGAREDTILMCAVTTILAGTLVAAVLATEDERLDLESRRWVSRARMRPLRVARGLLAVGGGRGAALTLALGSLVAVGALIGVAQVLAASAGLSSRTVPGSTHAPALLLAGALLLAIAIGTSLAFAVLPAYVLGRSPSRSGARKIARWTSAISLVTLSVFLPLLLIVPARGSFDEDTLFFSPLFVLVEAADEIEHIFFMDEAVFLWGLIGVAALVIAIPRVVRGIREVLQHDHAPDGH